MPGSRRWAALRAGDGGLRGDVAQEGGRIIRERVARYGIDCDLRDGNLFAAFTPTADARARGEAGALAPARDRQFRDARPGRRCGGTSPATPMLGGMLDRTGGHLHPLNLALGQAAALETPRRGDPRGDAGGARRGDRHGGAGGADGRRARCGREAVILAGNAYLGRGGAGDRRPGDAVLDADHGDRAARGAGGGAAADRGLRRGCALRARLLPAVGRRAAALGRRHRLWRQRSGGHPGEAGCRTSSGSFRSSGACGSTMPGRATARSRSAGCRSSGGSGRR